ncbi:MAG: hypothetical protein CTY16_10645 [Methylobacter sp.]|nr:MAG: hypothetical protein CTY16_10645 [Methylobacter sp.]
MDIRVGKIAGSDGNVHLLLHLRAVATFFCTKSARRFCQWPKLTGFYREVGKGVQATSFLKVGATNLSLQPQKIQV